MLRNLAGDAVANAYIADELRRCRIEQRPLSEAERKHPEMKCTIGGKIGTILLRREWRYWVAMGDVPLATARALYVDPVGARDVRVAGHCGCPAPVDPWLTYYDEEDLELVHYTADDIAICERMNLSYPQEGQRIVDDPRASAKRIAVTSYHIDSELGLYIFARAVEP